MFHDLKNEEDSSKSSEQCETVAQYQKGCALLHDRAEQVREEHIAHVMHGEEAGYCSQDPYHRRGSIRIGV